MRTAAVLLVAASVVVAGCGGDDDDAGSGRGPTPSTVPRAGAPTIEVAVGSIVTALDVEPFPPVSGATVTWDVAITNEGDETETLTFRSGLQVDVALVRDGDEVYRWSDGRAFTQAITEEELAPGETLEVSLDGERLDVEPGGYDVLLEPAFERSEGAVGRGTIEVMEGD